ncbi:alanine racemase [Deinococcus piscis]|uniref:Broad specificity amino-acid racemase n=1 Tax=Deinococcus piscis TaxID=394230 RepID=A0ABQ3JYJ1_9DEIO|nr:alanine racemase [Deinococcus piscis]
MRWFLLSLTLALPVAGAAPLLAGSAPAPASQLLQNTNAWIEVDDQAFADNIQTLQRELGGTSQLCAVMKADAYGNGIDLLMPTVVRLGVPCVAIGSNEEARVARAHGFSGRLMRVRTATDQEILGALAYDVEELLGNAEQARRLSAAMTEQGKTLRFHLGLNSAGMNRNGLDMATARGRLDALNMVRLPGLKVAGIMTHFPVEEEADVRRGLQVFQDESAWLIRAGGLDRRQLLLHAANSFATLSVPEARLDMVRPGGLLYGDTIASATQYRPTLSFKTTVATVNRYRAGTTVGYDRTFTLGRDSRLANLPMGYSDGYRRVFTNAGHVLIRGHRVPVVGKVSMNTTMIDVTDFPDIQPGDEVVLYGAQGQERISRDEVEEINGALLADLYTVWGNSNPRVLKSSLTAPTP